VIFVGIGTVFSVLALCGAVYTLLAIRTASGVLGQPLRHASELPPVTILKPLHGSEPELFENLQSFCRQNYPSPVQIVLGMESHEEEVGRILDSLPRTPQLEIDVIVNPRQHGANRKLSSLINMLPSVRHDVIVISDSDIGVSSDWLGTVVSALTQSGVGAVTCLYAGKPISNLWSKLMAMGVSYQFLPNVLVGTSFGLAKPCFGSTIALRRNTLAQIGGFAPFADVIQDDYALGDAIRASGLSVAVPPLIVTHTCAERTLAGWFIHELRWARTTRTIAPAGHLGSGVTHSLAWAVLGLAMLGLTPLALMALVAALGSRLALKSRMDRLLPAESGPLWLLPLRDLLSFLVFTASLFGTKIHWRGTRLEIRRHAALQS